MNKININGREYILLGTVNTGKREYVYILNGKTVELYKKTLDGYVMPNKDLTLEGNVGGSLTELKDVLGGMTSEEYDEMAGRASVVSGRLTTGFYTKKALSCAEGLI